MALHFGLHALVAYSISSHTMLASSNGGISDQKAETQNYGRLSLQTENMAHLPFEQSSHLSHFNVHYYYRWKIKSAMLGRCINLPLSAGPRKYRIYMFKNQVAI